jgi:hypothetical protein
MNCPDDNTPLEFIMRNFWKAGTTLYGCPTCDRLFTTNDCSLAGSTAPFKSLVFGTYSQYKKEQEAQKQQSK